MINENDSNTIEDKFNKTIEKLYNNKNSNSDVVKVDDIIKKLMGSYEIKKIKNTKSESNNPTFILEKKDKRENDLPVQIILTDKINDNNEVKRKNSVKIYYTDEHCKKCCKVCRFFCKPIEILVLILFYFTCCFLFEM